MKHLFVIAAAAIFASFIAPADSLSKKERNFAISSLRQTHDDVLKSVKGLSDAQLNYKPAPDRWSVKECLYHIALSEENLWQWADGVIKAPANPEKKTDIKVTDEQVIKGVSDRSHKVKTREALEPGNAKWTNISEALESFTANRDKLINYVKTTSDDLRSHIATETPMGALDAYQIILLISSHSNRHLEQINEVKADPGFPKN